MNLKNILVTLISSNEAQVVFRILLAVCLGALIGLEREHAHRPAGLRTHILVCVGSCLVMLTSEFIYSYYHQFSPNMDIARLGAQVISGVGFLGAGTIIRNGSSVKGLTTAASIWVVACIGLATGMGFYFGATIASIIIFLCLAYIKKISGTNDVQKFSLTLTTKTDFIDNILDTVEKNFAESSINVNHISITPQKEDFLQATFQLSLNASINPTSILSRVHSLPGIVSADIDSNKIIREEE